MPDALTVHRFGNGSHFQLNRAIQGKRGTYFNRLGNLSKALRLDLELVDSVGQALGVEVALIVRSECVAILVALADEFNRGFEGEAVGIGDFEAKLSGVALGVDVKSEEQESEKENADLDECAHGFDEKEPLCYQFRWCGIELRKECCLGWSTWFFTNCLHRSDKCGGRG